MLTGGSWAGWGLLVFAVSCFDEGGNGVFEAEVFGDGVLFGDAGAECGVFAVGAGEDGGCFRRVGGAGPGSDGEAAAAADAGVVCYVVGLGCCHGWMFW